MVADSGGLLLLLIDDTVCTSGSRGVQGVRIPSPLKNIVKGFNPKYKIIS